MHNVYKFGSHSERALLGVEAGLVQVVKLAIARCAVDFRVFEGLRTIQRQRDLVAQGRSKTLNSRHLTGDAVDLVPVIAGAINWRDMPAFDAIAEAMFSAADELGHLIQSGSDWNLNGSTLDETFIDRPHWQNPFPYRIKDAGDAADRRRAARHE